MKTRKNGKTFLIGCFLLLTVLSCKQKSTEEVPLGNVQKGTFYIDMYEEGEIEAVRSTTISAPHISWRYGDLKITELVKDGQEVQAGDTLIVFDPTEVLKGIVEAEGQLEIHYAELEKMEAQHQSQMEELRADYEVTRISQQISKIRFESAEYESDIKKKEIQLNLEKADIALDKAKEQIENRIKIQREEIRQKKLTIEKSRMRLEEAQETVKRLSVISPAPGIAILTRNWSTGNKYQIGDQCWSGSYLIKLPDLSALKAIVRINEVDISKIDKGLKVEIKPDAFSDSTFTGTVHSVANLAVNKEGSKKIKVFPVEVFINETHENLLPGMTVSCRIIIDEIPDVIYIPLEALHKEGDKNYVYKKTMGGFDKVEVETGISNSDYVIITKGLSEKDNVALINPFATEKESEEKDIE